MADNIEYRPAKSIQFRTGSEWAVLDTPTLSEGNAMVYNNNDWQTMAAGTGIFYFIPSDATLLCVLQPQSHTSGAQRVLTIQYETNAGDRVVNGSNAGLGWGNDPGVQITYGSISASTGSITQYTYDNAGYSNPTYLSIYGPNVENSCVFRFQCQNVMPIPRFTQDLVKMLGYNAAPSILIYCEDYNGIITMQEWTNIMNMYNTLIGQEFASYCFSERWNVTMRLVLFENSSFSGYSAYSFFQNGLAQYCNQYSQGFLTFSSQITLM